jgi:GDP-4-dehydro-6-deoxy-D-mannose reductase
VGIRVEVDPERYRPVDVPQVNADISKLRHTTGWVPETPLDQSLGDVLDYWRSRVSF